MIPRLAAIATCLIALALAASEAQAQSRLCRQLEARLVEVSAGGGASRETRRYDRAIEAQRGQIQRARRQMQRAGCSGGFSLFGRGDGSACPALSRTLRSMERNLAQLERRRGQLDGGRPDRRERARVLASLEANGCRDSGRRVERREAASPRESNGNIFERLWGGSIERRPRVEDHDSNRGQGRTIVRDYGGYGGGYGGGGTYRTLCVRTCDGYYFPISHASSRSDFDRDAQNCQAMCPGAEVRLFSHRVPDQESEEMVAEDGTAYADLPTAFKYREVGFVRPPGCGCGSTGPRNFTIIAGETPADQPQVDPEAVVVAPQSRPDPAADPETVANREGGLDPETISKMLTAKPVAGAETGERRVRVVGPAYLPDPEDEIDLRAPAQTAIQ